MTTFHADHGALRAALKTFHSTWGGAMVHHPEVKIILDAAKSTLPAPTPPPWIRAVAAGDRETLKRFATELETASFLIAGGFVWAKTPEGRDYWSNITGRLRAMRDELREYAAELPEGDK